jgi:hypothetical protein
MIDGAQAVFAQQVRSFLPGGPLILERELIVESVAYGATEGVVAIDLVLLQDPVWRRSPLACVAKISSHRLDCGLAGPEGDGGDLGGML